MPIKIRMEGYEVIEKVATRHATSAKILIPKRWIGKRVRAVRVDPDDPDESNKDHD